MSFELEMLQQIAGDLDIPIDEIEQSYEELFPPGPEFTNEVVVSTAFSKTSQYPDWYKKQAFERKFSLDYIKKHFGNPPIDSRLKWTTNPHDFGSYCEMEFVFNDSNEVHIEFFYKLETIDSEALQEAIQEAWDEEQCHVIQMITNNKKRHSNGF